jgi:hypothetical protein
MSETNQATLPSAAGTTTRVAFWEDAIELFVHPATVLRRRANTSVWPPMLFVAISIGVITYATFNTVFGPIFEAEWARNATATLAKNPQVSADVLNRTKDLSMNVAKFMVPIITAMTMFVVGIATWCCAKVVSAKTTFQQALVIAGWSYFPRVLGALLAGVQGLVMDPSKLNSHFSVSLSPARFLDPDTANPFVIQMLGRFDLITIWVTILLAIGVYVTGRVTKQQAAACGALVFLAGALGALRTAFAVS